MSASAQPVSSGRFAEALQELPLSTLHQTAAEIRNSRAHLESSNKELKPHADDGDGVCKEAIEENEQVMARMHARLDMLKAEVERRGMPWVDEDPTKNGEVGINGDGSNIEDTGSAAVTNGQIPSTTQRQAGGLLSDEELRRRMEERLLSGEDGEGDEDDGVHL